MDKENLYQYLAAEAEIEQIKRLIKEIERREQELWSAVTYGAGKDNSGMPRAHNHEHPDSKLVRYVDAAERLRKSGERLKERYIDMLLSLDERQLRVEEAVDGLPLQNRQVLRAKYLEGMEWPEMCREFNYSKRQLQRYLAEGVDMLERM